MDTLLQRSLDLFSELQRRRVFRVAVVYVVLAWVMAQVAETIFPNLGLPSWSVTLVMALFLIGFPISIGLAWAFDITPAGVERTRAAGAAAGEAMAAPQPIRTIVALPFATLSSNRDGQYISDGLTEELNAALARVPGLRVAARTSAFALQERNLDIREIGAQLGVDAAVEGSLRLVDTQVRITVQLTDVRDGYQIWSRTFDRSLDNILALQEDVARSIVAELRPGAVIADGALLRPTTTSDEAWALYLQGRFLWNRRTPAALNSAIDRFRSALEMDPSFALALAGMADCYSVLLDHGVVAPSTALRPALDAAERAVSLDPRLAETHTSLGLAAQAGLEWETAESAFRRAIEIDPGYTVAHQRYALLLARRGRDEEAVHSIGRAKHADPLSLIVAMTSGLIHYYARRSEAAAAEQTAVLSLDPEFAPAHLALGLIRLQQQRAKEAVLELTHAVDLTARGSSVLAPLGIALRAAGRDAEAVQIFDELTSRRTQTYVSPYSMAIAALGASRLEDARVWLRAAARERSPQLASARVDPLLDELREDGMLDDALAVVPDAAART